MPYLQNSKACGRIAKLAKVRGGPTFDVALKKTIMVCKSFENRVLKNADNVRPVVGFKAGVPIERPVVVKKSLKTINSCGRRCAPEPKDKPGILPHGKTSVPVANFVPEKCFCIPNFDQQVAIRPSIVPKDIRDNNMFLFVDIVKFLPRNAAAAAYHIIFKSLFDILLRLSHFS